MKYAEISNQFRLNGLEESPKSYGVSPRGSFIFTKRAILNVGFMLEKSKVALEVRNQVLNIKNLYLHNSHIIYDFLLPKEA